MDRHSLTIAADNFSGSIAKSSTPDTRNPWDFLFLKGGRNKDIRYPSEEAVVSQAIPIVRGWIPQVMARMNESSGESGVKTSRRRYRGIPKAHHSRGKQQKNIGANPILASGGNTGVNGSGFLLVHALADDMQNSQYAAIVNEKIDPLRRAVQDARSFMAAHYKDGNESVLKQLEAKSALYGRALHRVLSAVAAEFASVPVEILVNLSVEAIDQVLIQFDWVLGLWSEAVMQLKDEKYSRQLQVVIQVLEQIFRLFLTGDLKGLCDAGCQERLKLRSFTTKDSFLSMVGPYGLATMPGAPYGPLKFHILLYPAYMWDLLALYLGLVPHEVGHNILTDTDGLEEEYRDKVPAMLKLGYQKGLDGADQNGAILLPSQTVQIGKQHIQTIDLLVKAVLDTFTEIFADVSGMLSIGPSFLLDMIMTFGAMRSEGNALRTHRYISSQSVYTVQMIDQEHAAIILEVHPPDTARAEICLEVLRALGMLAEEDYCRKRVDQLAGYPLEEQYKWTNDDSSVEIKLDVATWRAILPVLVTAIIDTPMKALGDNSLRQLVNWSPERQAMALRIASNLVAGKADLPTDIGTIYHTHIIAAAVQAAWDLADRGDHVSLHALPMINKLTIEMLEESSRRINQRSVLSVPEPWNASCPDSSASNR
jgi:hypothetical protein